MNLVVDIGNTSTKLALFENGRKISISRINILNIEELEGKIKDLNIEKAIISSVRELPRSIIDFISSIVPFLHILSYKSRLPFRIGYNTPETLGTDRIAGIAGAFNMFPDSDLLVIDTGTAITYDYLSGGIYEGGNISPGLGMRFRALNKFTDKLPLLDITDNFTSPGRNTNDAIVAGVVTGVTFEINEYIRTFEKKSGRLNIILTGGDSGYLKDKIRYQIIFLPDVVMDGLNTILEYNAT